MEITIDSRLEKAEQLLDNANEGLCKPEEDVVPYMICQNSNDAIVQLLSAFIKDSGKILPPQQTVENLLKVSREINADFKDLHLAPFYHPTDTEDIWMNLDTAKDFLKMAEKAKEIVVAHLSK